MALNLSTLTSPATSGNVLEAVTTTADFLESCPVLRNLARGTNAGGDATQSVALNQPKALPLIKNPAGDLGGYLYIPNVAGNYATGPSVTIGSNATWEAEVDMVITQYGSYIRPLGGGDWSSGFGLLISATQIFVFSKTGTGVHGNILGITLGTPFNLKYGFDGTYLYAEVDGSRANIAQPTNQGTSITHSLELNQQTLNDTGNYAIQKAKLTVNSAVVFDCDFNASTSIRHGDTKFQAAVGGDVTLTRTGNDPATVIKKPVLRFSSATSGLKGLFANQIDGGYMFAAFSVLGGGGESNGRVFSVNATGDVDYSNGGAVFNSRHISTNNSVVYVGTTIYTHEGLFDDTNGDVLNESKLISGTQYSSYNNADVKSNTATLNIQSDEFNIGQNEDGIRSLGQTAALDLEYLALFPATITDAQADQIRNYINNRNNVFYRWDTDGYYFFDAAATYDGQVFTGSGSWNGRIVGSDLGDSDFYINQNTSNDLPTSDGYKVTFADNTDHFDIPSTTQAGWQIVGTSLGTFAYRVNANAVTELNLLGNAGAYRQAGDLYGIILLPASATSREIEQARKLLIDKGASDSVAGDTTESFWHSRSDIVEFSSVDFTGVSNVRFGWNSCSAMTNFNVNSLPDATNVYNTFRSSGLTSFNTDLPAAVRVDFAWKSCASLASFGTVDISNCTNFSSAWEGTTALTQFPQEAKLGTEVSDVNFANAWRSSGLSSFSTPLLTATNLSNAFLGCSSLTTFSTALPKAEAMGYSWYNCSSLTDFSADVFSNWNPSGIGSGVFNETWANCTSLTAQSVENILTSIDASGKHGTSDGTSGGTPLADAGIDIDYDVSTGSLSAATLSAIDSLSGKGWQVFINGEHIGGSDDLERYLAARDKQAA